MQISTESAVLDLSEQVLSIFVQGKYTVATFIDLSEAFDTMDRLILIRKLTWYDVNGLALEWIINHFSERKQFVNILGVYFPTIPIVIDKAQGSGFSPLMFVVCMNDIGR